MDHPQKGARFAPHDITAMGLELIPILEGICCQTASRGREV